MEFVVGFVVLLILGFFLSGWLGLAWAVSSEKKKKQHEANADETMAQLFDGSSSVVYSSPDTSGGLSIETLMKGANAHSYRLVSETGNMAARRIVFEKVNLPHDAVET